MSHRVGVSILGASAVVAVLLGYVIALRVAWLVREVGPMVGLPLVAGAVAAGWWAWARVTQRER